MEFRLSDRQFTTLMDYIDSRIDERICSDHGRDTLIESIRTSEFREELYKVFVSEVEP